MRNFAPRIQAVALLVTLSLGSLASLASSSGYTGVTLAGSGTGCTNSCHTTTTGVTVTTSGPTALNAGQSGTYTVTGVKSGATGNMGLDVASTDAGSLSSIAGQPTTVISNQITHNTNGGTTPLKAISGGTASYTFTYTMPAAASPGSMHTLSATAAMSFAGWNHASNFSITTRPTATTSTTANGATATTMNVAWTGGGPSYRVVYKTGAAAPTSETDGTNGYEGTATSTTITGLSASTQYTFRVFSKLNGQSVFATTGANATATTLASTALNRYVNAATGSDASNSCTVVSSPCRTISYAMGQATAGNPGDTVSVAPGYYSMATGEVFPIVLKSGVSLIGTAGAEATLLDARGDNVRQGMLVNSGNTSSTTTIQGIAFANGVNVPLQGGVGTGGAVRIVNMSSGQVTITRNIFRDNEARGYTADNTLGHTGGLGWGGAIYVFASAVNITNNVFYGNIARGGDGFDHPASGLSSNENGGPANGGAIYFAGSGFVTNNTFHSNRAIGGNGGFAGNGRGIGGNATGGAIAADGNPAPSINNNIYVYNSADGGFGDVNGAAIAGAMSNSGVPNATNNLFASNTANNGASNGDVGTSPILATPVFHAEIANLRLRPGSPGIAAGTSAGPYGTPAVDADSVPRPGTPSVGAFEGSTVQGVSADLSVTATAMPGTASTDKDVVYQVTLINNGPNTASNVMLTDRLPSGWVFIWASPGCTVQAGSATCFFSSVPAGPATVLKFVVRPLVTTSSGITTRVNRVFVSGTVNDSNPANNVHTSSVTVNASPSATAILRYRLYSDVTKEHHFTTDLNEYNTLGTYPGWVQEGTVGKLLNNPGIFGGVRATPYYRLYNSGTAWHHWTTDTNEYYTLAQYPGWSAEGVDGYILPSATTGATQLYRLLYPYVAGGLHHWTIDANEYNTLINSYGWIGEGGSGFVVQ